MRKIIYMNVNQSYVVSSFKMLKSLIVFFMITKNFTKLQIRIKTYKSLCSGPGEMTQ